MANTKLTKVQKLEHKNRRTQFPDVCFFHGVSDQGDGYVGVTIAMYRAFPASKMMRLSTAIASTEEVKYRKSVGGFLALNRMLNGEYITVPYTFDVVAFMAMLASDRT